MKRAFFACVAVLALVPAPAFACACGCSIFDVGTSSLIPSGPGGTAFLELDLLDQTKNWSGDSRAPAADNDDKHISSEFWLAGGQYMFDEDWGAMVEVPYTERLFKSADPDNTGTFRHDALGDIKLMGVYSGFDPDMSSGVIFGVKLPTGDHTYAHFDSDVEIGSGSTDLILGAYKTGAFDVSQSFSWFAQAMWQHEVATQNGYTPGSELNGAAGVSWNDMGAGLVPILQMLVSRRGRDSGANGEPDETGYTRLLISPGLEARIDSWKLYADVELPVYQHVNGDQLVAPAAFKFVASYAF
ncbi:MAG TPA: hypothetical protein VLW75_08375 [Rhizomicrobium sp.]|nr:hypothetical protein [Rhizomicrobium sp.]